MTTSQRFTRSGLPVVPYQINGLGEMGDDPATIAQIIEAGYDPTADNVTYTVDSSGNVTQNLTIRANPIVPFTGPQPPIWPLIAILGLMGYSLFEVGKRS